MPLHQAAAEGVADAGRIDDPAGATAGTSTCPSRVITDDPCSPRVTISVLATHQDVRLAHPGLLPQQLELVVVDDDDRRADDAVAQLVA